MGDPLTDLRFAVVALDESRRTLVVHPSRVDEARALLASAGVTLWDVRGSTLVAADQVFVFDPNALEAQRREWAQALPSTP